MKTKVGLVLKGKTNLPRCEGNLAL